MAKRYPFESTCMNDAQADYKINAIKEEYRDHPDWEIGKTTKETLPSGEVKIVVDLIHYEKGERLNQNESNQMHM